MTVKKLISKLNKNVKYRICDSKGNLLKAGRGNYLDKCLLEFKVKEYKVDSDIESDLLFIMIKETYTKERMQNILQDADEESFPCIIINGIEIRLAQYTIGFGDDMVYFSIKNTNIILFTIKYKDIKTVITQNKETWE